jgi:phosphoribosyl 1,2-cyclic phosphodiesterase
MIQIRFHGVRGSIASAGAHSARVGGNTSCVELRCFAGSAREEMIVLDAGTGLRGLGDQLTAACTPVKATLLLSHLHWDHIQGFPFFGPAYRPDSRLRVVGPAEDGDLRAALARQMCAPHFPVGLEVLRADLRFEAVPADVVFSVGDCEVYTGRARHPNGCLAYRVRAGGKSVVYATDTEHDDGDAGGVDPHLLELCRGADVLIYDAQYTPAEYLGEGGRPSRRGWGHSTAEAGVRLADAAGVSRLVLFHHDPARDDDAIAVIEEATRRLCPGALAAREGLVLSVGEPARAPAATAVGASTAALAG